MCWGLQPPTGEVSGGWHLGRDGQLSCRPFGAVQLWFLYQHRELPANPLEPRGTGEAVNIQVSVLFYQNSCCCFQVFSPQFLVYFSRASSIDSFYWLCLCNQLAVLSCSINLEFKMNKYCLLGVFLMLSWTSYTAGMCAMLCISCVLTCCFGAKGITALKVHPATLCCRGTAAIATWESLLMSLCFSFESGLTITWKANKPMKLKTNRNNWSACACACIQLWERTRQWPF